MVERWTVYSSDCLFSLSPHREVKYKNGRSSSASGTKKSVPDFRHPQFRNCGEGLESPISVQLLWKNNWPERNIISIKAETSWVVCWFEFAGVQFHGVLKPRSTLQNSSLVQQYNDVVVHLAASILTESRTSALDVSEIRDSDLSYVSHYKTSSDSQGEAQWNNGNC